MRIAVYAICRDEALFAERFAKAAADADYIVVADTGSKDGTQAILRAHGVTVHEISISPWRFDDARNAALALVPGDADVCLSLDLDEVVNPGWRTAIESGWTGEANRGRYRYVFSHDDEGRDGVAFMNNRIHARHGFRWRHACHEGIYPDRTAEHYVVLNDLRVDHWPDKTKSRDGYLPLLEHAYAEEPHEPRMAHYYARELVYRERWQEALDVFGRYMAMSDPAYVTERGKSLIYMAQCLERLDRLDEARRQFRLAVAEAPQMRETWVGLSERAYKDKDWPASFAAARAALALNDPFSGQITDPKAWDHTAEDLAAIAAWNLGFHEDSLAHAERALAITPGDERLKRNVESIRKGMAKPADVEFIRKDMAKPALQISAYKLSPKLNSPTKSLSGKPKV